MSHSFDLPDMLFLSNLCHTYSAYFPSVHAAFFYQNLLFDIAMFRDREG